MKPTPIHCRRPTLKPKTRSASTVSITSPPQITAWTVDSGARARAATWSTQAPNATSMPIANHLERKSAAPLLERVRPLDVGCRHAPRCL